MRTQVRRSAYVCCAIGLLFSIQATSDGSPTPERPKLLEETAKVLPPGPSGQIVRRVALSGKHLLIATRRNTERPEGSWSEQFAHLFHRRGDGSWVYVSTLATTSLPNQQTPPMAVDVRDRIAAVNAGQLMIFERAGSKWKEVAKLPSSGNLDLEIDAGTIVVSEPGCAWEAFRKLENAWTRVAVVSPSTTCNLNPGFSEDIDVSGTRIVVANPFISNPQGMQWPSRVRVFESISSSAPAVFITDPLNEDESGFGIPVAVDKGTIFAGLGATVLAFERDSNGIWNHQATLEPADSLLLMFVGAVQSRDGLTAVGYPLDPQRGSAAGSVGVFRRDAAEIYTEVARLLASDAVAEMSLGGDVDVDGRRVVASARDAAYIFRLPSKRKRSAKHV